MTLDELFLTKLGKTYEDYLQHKNDFNFAIDEVQLKKLCGITDFLNNVALDCGGSVEPIELRPREEHGGVTANFTIFDVHGEQLETLHNLIKDISALSIDIQDGEVCISVTIPNIFIPRK